MNEQMKRHQNAVPTYRMDKPFDAGDPFDGVPYTRLPMPSKQDAMFVKIKSPLGEDDLLFDAFEGREALSELFEFHVRLYAPDPDIDFKKLLGKNLSVCITTIQKKKASNARFLAGIVTQIQALPSFVLETTPPKLAYYNVTLRPSFWLSTLSKGFRVFMKKKTIEIIESVLKEDKVDFTNKASAGKTVREYCVQYDESNFDFVSRLMEEEGIFYYFEFSASGAKMILADANKLGTDLGEFPMETFRPDVVNGITLLNAQNQVVAKKFEAVDRDYMKPSTSLKATGSGQSLGGEVYEYPGNFLDSGGASKTGPLRMKEIAAPENLTFGQSGVLAFQAGGIFKLTKHPRKALNQKYFLIAVEHRIQQRPPQTLQGPRSPLREKVQMIYANRFTAMPNDTPFMPPRTTPRPKIYGVQTALVVGPKGKEIYCDKEGRVFVQFLWDREGKKDEKSSLPVRCMQGWAGGNFGLAFVPRIGMEVLVAFENGDPDRPIIVGCLYNGENKMPDAVPKEPRIAMLKTQTSPDSKESNIMSFDDTKDKEKIYFHATKDYELQSEAKDNQFLVKQDGDNTKTQTQIKKGLLETAIKEGEKKVQIDKGNYSIQLKKGSMTIKLDDGDKVLTLAKGNYTINIQKGKMTVTAKQDIAFQTDANFSVTAKKDIKLTAQGDISLKAMKNITLKSTLDTKIDAKAISEKATMDCSRQGLNVSDKATVEYKRQGLNVSDKATLMVKGEGLMANYKGTVAGVYAGLTATLKADTMAATQGGALAALKGGGIALG